MFALLFVFEAYQYKAQKMRHSLGCNLRRGLAMRQSFLAACVCVGVVGCSTPAGPPLDTLQQIQGEIIRFDADGYVIRDGYGKEMRVHATPTARVDGNLSAGDTVLVHVAAPYQPKTRYAQAVYHFTDLETVYGELTEKNRSSISVKDADRRRG